MRIRREAWFTLQPDLDPTRLVFLDETGATTRMSRLRGRAPRGDRCRAALPHGHWKTTTLVAGLRLDGLTAPMVIDGAMNGEGYTAYAETLLAPTLNHGDSVIMGQSPRPQGRGRPGGNRTDRSDTDVPPALLAGLQSDRVRSSQSSRRSCEKPPQEPSGHTRGRHRDSARCLHPQ